MICEGRNLGEAETRRQRKCGNIWSGTAKWGRLVRLGPVCRVAGLAQDTHVRLIPLLLSFELHVPVCQWHCIWDFIEHDHTRTCVSGIRGLLCRLPWGIEGPCSPEISIQFPGILLIFGERVSLCCPGWGAMAQSWFTVPSTSLAKVILLPQPPG